MRVTVNYRFAPSLTPELAARHVQTIFEGFDVQVIDAAAGALPGLAHPAAQAFVGPDRRRPAAQVRLDRRRALQRAGDPGGQLRARGPVAGAHREEYVPTSQVRETFEVMRAWLVG